MTNTPKAKTAPLFSLGQIVSTPGALDAMKAAATSGFDLLRRHMTGDWGEVCDEDRQENDRSVKAGNRILSVYELSGTGVKLWIITEADRSVTTFLLPSEY